MKSPASLASAARFVRALSLASCVGAVGLGPLAAQSTGTLVRAEGQRAELVGITGGADLGGTADARLGAHITACRGALPLTAADSVQVLAHRLVPGLAPNLDASQVRFVVLPVERIYINCGGSSRELLATRGVRFARDLNASTPRVERVELRDGDRVIAPSLVREATLAIVGSWGVRLDSSEGMVLEYPIDAFASPTAGRTTHLEFRVWTGGDSEPERLDVPLAMLDRLWDHALKSRLSALPGPRAAAGLRAADIASASTAQADAAASLALRGDATAARVLHERALRGAPCLSAPATAPDAVRRMDAEAARPDARCEAMPLHTVALRGALLPGFGRRLVRADVRGMTRSVPTIAVGTLLAAGITIGANARYKYYRYIRANQTGQPTSYQEDVAGYYETAESKRRTAQFAVRAGATVWGASLLLDLLAEHRFARRLTLERGHVGLSLPLP